MGAFGVSKQNTACTHWVIYDESHKRQRQGTREKRDRGFVAPHSDRGAKSCECDESAMSTDVY
jgi:hypothetical protein